MPDVRYCYYRYDRWISGSPGASFLVPHPLIYTSILQSYQLRTRYVSVQYVVNQRQASSILRILLHL